MLYGFIWYWLVQVWDKAFSDFKQITLHLIPFDLIYSWIIVMRCSNTNKYGQPRRKLMKGIMDYFQINFIEDVHI